MQKFSYHTHTDFSDGRDSIKQMISHAESIGFEELGITDHLIINKLVDINNLSSRQKNFYYSNALSAKSNLERHIENIRKISKEHSSIKVRVGFEVDFYTYNGWLDELKELMKKLDIDYLISGNHKLIYNNKLIDIVKESQDLDTLVMNELVKAHFDSISQAISSGLFRFIAHLDYIRWGGFVTAESYKEERMQIIEALANNNIAYELSTKGLRAINDFYPARWMLEELNKREVPVVISDDAHRTEQLGIDFNKAEDLLKELNYTNRWKY